ncbi:heme-thiolate peroxidase [Flagelloscypha sp. PMI_526]|nr:heme-thiolate peroxidase [Flagelloscypha sp. PMI_526]
MAQDPTPSVDNDSATQQAPPLEERVLSFQELQALIESGKVDQIPNNKLIPEAFNTSSWTVLVLLWDVGLATLNLVLPTYKKGSLVAAHHGGQWPEYRPPGEGDSRSGCPALNAMANHGILPRNGKNITFAELNQKTHETFNFAPSFCFFVPNFCARFLHKNYKKDTFDLADLNLRSDDAIEHEGSLLREDEQIEPDVSKVASICVNSKTVAAALSLRRYEARTANPNFKLAKSHEFFGSANATTLLRIYGGNVEELEAHLIEERIPDGWEPYPRERFGLTMMSFNGTAKKIGKLIDEDKAAAQARSTAN